MKIQAGKKEDRSLELVVGLVAPIGVNLDKVQRQLVSVFGAINFEVEEIRLTDLMVPYVEQFGLTSDAPTLSERKIDEANSLCSHIQDDAAMAYLAVLEIVDRRAKLLQSRADEDLRVIYVVRQLKRKAERDILADVYGRRFLQISITDKEENRRINLTNSLLSSNPQLDEEEAPVVAARLLQRDEDEKRDFGQEVSNLFASGDFFSDLSSQKDTKSEIERFVRAFLGDNRISPTRDEFGAYMAKAASLRSVDLSRQVGAALFNSAGDVISMGCNEVPRAGGGNYWHEDQDKMRDVELGASSNKAEIRRIAFRFLNRLEEKEALRDGLTAASLLDDESIQLSETELFDVTEYGRMTHAEMSALCDAARNGVSTRGGHLHVTTFPCHNCAKHIVASGVARVIFIEPYQKSKALNLHKDAIGRGVQSSGRVSFEHFQGISPARYRDIFEKSKRTNGLAIKDWDEGEPIPRIGDRSFGFRTLERSLEGAATKLFKQALDDRRAVPVEVGEVEPSLQLSARSESQAAMSTGGAADPQGTGE